MMIAASKSAVEHTKATTTIFKWAARIRGGNGTIQGCVSSQQVKAFFGSKGGVCNTNRHVRFTPQ
jgi:hypothetical protein